ncbi:MAG: histidine phosphatase family protein [Saprospiraceae bacterium]|nr:histidine phosphatase family protein [Saprospiraceae bacterium]MBK8486080.1 histidine phosphatase family protein [Saprospiraceae bacterium]MBK9221126.1 histidine phosphatase family protein [Saprospiraceae bacterium]
MNPKLIYILRHGETNQNRHGIVQGRGINSSLNEIGIAQANAFYNYYKEIPFDVFFCSSQNRSYETIQNFENHVIPIVKDHRLDEIGWGEHEGKAGDPELMLKYTRIINSWSDGNYHDAAEGGESAHVLSERLNSFIEDLEKMDFNKALICTHGRTMRAMICLLQKIPLSYMEEVKHQNTGLYISCFQQNHWKILQENDSSHLPNSFVF